MHRLPKRGCGAIVFRDEGRDDTAAGVDGNTFDAERGQRHRCDLGCGELGVADRGARIGRARAIDLERSAQPLFGHVDDAPCDSLVAGDEPKVDGGRIGNRDALLVAPVTAHGRTSSRWNER
jgi:hypothetical protein